MMRRNQRVARAGRRTTFGRVIESLRAPVRLRVVRDIHRARDRTDHSNSGMIVPTRRRPSTTNVIMEPGDDVNSSRCFTLGTQSTTTSGRTARTAVDQGSHKRTARNSSKRSLVTDDGPRDPDAPVVSWVGSWSTPLGVPPGGTGSRLRSAGIAV